MSEPFPDEETWLMEHPEVYEKWEWIWNNYNNSAPLLSEYITFKYEEAKYQYET